MEVLLVGVGALGCEILKNLPSVVPKNTTVAIVDFDTIEVTNLHRQFLFHNEDVGLPKCHVAMERMSQLFPTLKMLRYLGRIEGMPLGFLEKFDIVISAVDSLSTRLWLSSTLFSLEREMGKSPLFIDCGMEGSFLCIQMVGLFGHTFSTKIGSSPCIGCISGLYAPRLLDHAYCSIRNSIPSVQNILLWVLYVLWDQEVPFGPISEFSLENREHFDWVIQRCMSPMKGIGPHSFSKTEFVAELTSFQIISPASISMSATIGGMAILQLYHYLQGRSSSSFTYISLKEPLHVYSFVPQASPDCNYCNNVQIYQK